MAAKEADTNGATDIDVGSENQSAVEVVVLDSDGEKTGIAAAAASACVFRAVPPFLQKLYEMLENDEFSPQVSWSGQGTCFLIKNPNSFAATVLPFYFRHSNFDNFITQLHAYGFKKTSWEQYEYKNEYFRRGEWDLLKNIKRRDRRCSRINTKTCIANMDKELTILINEHDQVKADITVLKEKQQILENKFDSLQKQITMDRKRTMLVAQKLLEKQMDQSNRETQLGKGKRKFESDTRHNEEKRKLNREEVEKHYPGTFFSLDEFEPVDWIEYVKELPKN